MLNMGPKLSWKPPIVPTVASRGEGVEELVAAIDRHRSYLESSGEGAKRRLRQLEEETADLVGEWSRAQARKRLREDGRLRSRLEKEQAPYGAAETILKLK